MSSTALRHQQHLTSADMAMIMRVHEKACAKNAILAKSLDSERTAALMYQGIPVWCEQGGRSSGRLHGRRCIQAKRARMDRFIGNALNRWEADGDKMVSADRPSAAEECHYASQNPWLPLHRVFGPLSMVGSVVGALCALS